MAKQGKIKHLLQSCSLWELSKLPISAKNSPGFILQCTDFRFAFLAYEEEFVSLVICFKCLILKFEQVNGRGTFKNIINIIHEY